MRRVCNEIAIYILLAVYIALLSLALAGCFSCCTNSEQPKRDWDTIVNY